MQQNLGWHKIELWSIVIHQKVLSNEHQAQGPVQGHEAKLGSHQLTSPTDLAATRDKESKDPRNSWSDS